MLILLILETDRVASEHTVSATARDEAGKLHIKHGRLAINTFAIAFKPGIITVPSETVSPDPLTAFPR
ncbi:hypothetical protein GCM10011338_33250 [Alteromonas lipolytica]|nr:hypothetical protein GCM10011338_33250 [Alteromonas lipolytica]